jgi:hypothetical protein
VFDDDVDVEDVFVSGDADAELLWFGCWLDGRRRTQQQQKRTCDRSVKTKQM